ncbi:MAG: ATP-binding protein [Pseudomonadota bacterium]
MLKQRYLVPQVKQDIEKKMVFVGGPRQVGKTTMAKHLLAPIKKGYLNWDISENRERILKRELPHTKMWVFDEIHKYSSWRNYLKGIFDKFGNSQQILVTGSAMLDYYRRGGDSLQGRYHYLRLHPLSIAELKLKSRDDFSTLLQLGGFPEPFFSGSDIEAKRWSREYRERLIQEDLLSLEAIRDVGNLELLMLRLPDLVGSPLSINALREDLGVSHKTVTNWIKILTRLYAIFLLPPFGSPLIRAVTKEQKHYHTDWSLVKLNALRFENMLACHLLKWIHYEQDTKARDLELRYFRDIDGREVDFIITENKKPIFAIECKSSAKDISPGLKYFKHKFPDCQAWQIYMNGSKDYLSGENIRVTHALNFLSDLTC